MEAKMWLSCQAAKKHIGFAIAIVLLAHIAIAADGDKEKSAVAAAEKWLALVDNGKYADSWQAAAEVFRRKVDQKSWEQGLLSDRKPEGECIARTFTASESRKPPSVATDRERITIRFNTSFLNRKYAIERLTLVFDKDGQWRVTGYLVSARFPDLKNILMALLLLVVIVGAWFVELKPAGGREERLS